MALTGFCECHLDRSSRTPVNQADVGVLNINKPRGPTSHDIVAGVRRLSGQRRVGHAGTLDPMATGVLVVCLGKATRIVEYIVDGHKSYLATIHFGVITDTWDAEGQVIEQRDWSQLSFATIERALSRFTGRIEQVPPMYSALRYQGKPLYHLARQGITVKREPRVVQVQCRVVSWRAPELTLQIDCSKGTYVRSLAYDLGEAVGPGAHLCSLTRTAVGSLQLEDSVSFDLLLRESAGGRWRRHLLPISAVLADMPSVTVDQETARRIGFGQGVGLTLPADTELCCAYDEHDRLVAILKPGSEGGLWRPHKVLATR